MSLRAKLRDEFPRRWFISPTWWFEGLVELTSWFMITVFGAFMIYPVGKAIKHRRHPEVLAKINQEPYQVSMVVNIFMLMWVFTGTLPWPVSLWTGLLFLLNAAVIATMNLVVFSSRRQQPAVWKMLDFVQRYDTKGKRPPETIEEYRAASLSRALSD